MGVAQKANRARAEDSRGVNSKCQDVCVYVLAFMLFLVVPHHGGYTDTELAHDRRVRCSVDRVQYPAFLSMCGRYVFIFYFLVHLKTFFLPFPARLHILVIPQAFSCADLHFYVDRNVLKAIWSTQNWIEWLSK